MATRPTILLVEDEPLLREMTMIDLEDLGFSVLCASDSSEALRELSRDLPIGILITDIRMPGEFDGWELARRARSLWPELGVIYVSGYSNYEPQPVTGSIFLKKPYRLVEIENALAQLGVA